MKIIMKRTAPFLKGETIYIKPKGKVGVLKGFFLENHSASELPVYPGKLDVLYSKDSELFKPLSPSTPSPNQ